MKIDVVRDAAFPEWSHVLQGGVTIGLISRSDALGLVRWTAYGPGNHKLGEFSGRRSRGKAIGAVTNANRQEK